MTCLHMQAAAKKIRCSEVLTIHGTKDNVTPVDDALQWGKHIAHHQLKIIDGADHSFLMPQISEKMIAAVVEQCAL
jgi:alpha/beta superfamily hydrolase